MSDRDLEVSILPDVGAKIWDVIHRGTGYNFLWHNPRIQPKPYDIDANFDNYWCGGWDDGFPTCEPCQYNGEQYPALGELRSLKWNVESHSEKGREPHVSLSAFGPISPVRAQKTINLAAGSLLYKFDIENIGPLPLDFIWGTHPAFQISPASILHVPARFGLVGQSTTPALGAKGQKYAWPNLETSEGKIDMSRVHPFESGLAAGHYGLELSEGWFAVEDTARGTGVLFEFPLDVCPYVWMWLTYGGWRGYYVAIVEPWTSFPVTLSEAVTQNTHRQLASGETFSVRLRVTPWTAPDSLADFAQRLRS